jgi:hypothetical protein
MSYKFAVQQLFRKAPKKRGILSELPNGWIYLQKNGYVYDTWSTWQRNHYQEKLDNKQKGIHVQEMTDRFLEYKRQDLERDGYDMYEIDDILYSILNDDNPDDYESTSDYDSDGSYESI